MKLSEAWVELLDWLYDQTGDNFDPDKVIAKMEYLEGKYE